MELQGGGRYSYPITGLERPLDLQDFESSRISRQSAHGGGLCLTFTHSLYSVLTHNGDATPYKNGGGKVVSPKHRPHLPPGDIPCTHFCWNLSRPHGHSAAGRFTSTKNPNDPIGNRIRDLPACRAVPHPGCFLRRK